ncbi:MAG: hypothetical protein EOO06_07590 [Chitinophagaceae bacterium]|nr:MAG: hypothetical protein EOO06_07590 [Chitinophagaceae bacterium]
MNKSDNAAYNKAVKYCHMQVLKQAKQMLSSIEQEELRYTLERQDRPPAIGSIIHEMVNPLLYTRLEYHTNELFAIHWGIEAVNQLGQLSSITTSFVRLLYNLTNKENTSVNIEESVRTDWFINQPSAMFEYIEERGLRHHTFKLLPYKPTATKRKLRPVA